MLWRFIVESFCNCLFEAGRTWYKDPVVPALIIVTHCNKLLFNSERIIADLDIRFRTIGEHMLTRN